MIVEWFKDQLGWKSGARQTSTQAQSVNDRPSAESLLHLLPATTWVLDEVRRDANQVSLRGWLLLNGLSANDITFTINGVACTDEQFNLHRPDIEALFWFKPDSGASGFTASITNAELANSDELTVQLADSTTLKPINPHHAFYWRTPKADTLPLPPPDRRRRVHGSTDEDSFRITGYSSFRKLETALTEVTGKTYANFNALLDWGCGCGRVLRYFSTEAASRATSVTGVDIDSDNIRWCQSNYPFAQFTPVPLVPPTDLANESYDLVIGLSVFTHLREKAQHWWLSELKRITKPGAVLLLTTLGSTGILRGGLRVELFDQWDSVGFCEAGQNHDLQGVLKDENYYINTFHSIEYIKKVWGAHFEVLEVLEGCIGNHQDLVVLARR